MSQFQLFSWYFYKYWTLQRPQLYSQEGILQLAIEKKEKIRLDAQSSFACWPLLIRCGCISVVQPCPSVSQLVSQLVSQSVSPTQRFRPQRCIRISSILDGLVPIIFVYPSFSYIKLARPRPSRGEVAGKYSVFGRMHSASNPTQNCSKGSRILILVSNWFLVLKELLKRSILMCQDSEYAS